VITTSVGFDEGGFNELEHARTVARHLGVTQHEEIVRPEITDLLPALAWHLDEPFADSSAVPTYYVSRRAREHVTVALSGDGGDELWAGYARHRVEQWELTARRGSGRGRPSAGGSPAPAARRQGHRDRCATSRCRPADACAASTRYGMFETERGRLYSRDFAHEVRDADPFAGFRDAYDACASRDPLDRALYVDVEDLSRRRHPDQGRQDEHGGVARSARAAARSQAAGVRRHVPDVAEAEERPSKYLLRRCSSAASRSRSSIGRSTDSRRRSANGCAARWRRWSTACSSTAAARARHLRRRRSRRVWREHRDGRRDHRHRLWSLVMLELWFRQFVDGSRRRVRGDDVAAHGDGAIVMCWHSDCSDGLGELDCDRGLCSRNDTRHRRRQRTRQGWIEIMCGIAGIVGAERLAGDTPARALRMRDIITHRGPDEAGLHWDGVAALAHRRLSIVDVSTGQQPLSNEDGSVWVSFNGEIYNHAEIRHELEARGHAYRTKSDTETIVHAYEEWGDAAVHRFRGMFAFAIWDAPRRRLLLVRDRLGIKPLYWARAGDALLFGSEIKAILASGLVEPVANEAVLPEMLSTRYASGTETLFKDIYKLLPGHLLVLEHGTATVRQYWDLPRRSEHGVPWARAGGGRRPIPGAPH
jgi:hypothetical protein